MTLPISSPTAKSMGMNELLMRKKLPKAFAASTLGSSA